MNHFERLKACIQGEETDCIPIALWRHFPVIDQTADALANATIEWHNTFNFDFIKVTPASSFCVRDWGCKDDYRENVRGIRHYTSRPISKPDQWYYLPKLDPTDGHLGEQLRCLEIILNSMGSFVPVVQTIFSPLIQMEHLVGPENLYIHLKKYSEAAHVGLRIISDTTAAFVKQAITLGIDGIFFVIRHSDIYNITNNEYFPFGRPYDLKVIEQAREKWLNILHIHGSEDTFSHFIDYPVSVMSLHGLHQETVLRQAHEAFRGAICGGLQRSEIMANGTPAEVRKQAKTAIMNAQYRRFILAAECGLFITTNRENILAALSVV